VIFLLDFLSREGSKFKSTSKAGEDTPLLTFATSSAFVVLLEVLSFGKTPCIQYSFEGESVGTDEATFPAAPLGTFNSGSEGV
jgi:hypothetical protein